MFYSLVAESEVDLQKFEKKRAVFAKLNNTVLEEYYDETDTDKESTDEIDDEKKEDKKKQKAVSF